MRKTILTFLAVLIMIGTGQAYTPVDTTYYVDFETSLYNLLSEVPNAATVWPALNVRDIFNRVQDYTAILVSAPEFLDTIVTTADSSWYDLNSEIMQVDHVVKNIPDVSAVIGLSEVAGWQKGKRNTKETEPPLFWWQWGNNLHIQPFGVADTLFIYGISKPTFVTGDSTVLSFERKYIPLLLWSTIEWVTFSTRDPEVDKLHSRAIEMTQLLINALLKKTDPEGIPVTVGGQ